MSDTAPFPAPIDALVEIALEAGREIMAERAANTGFQTKADGSVVTLADVAAERIICRGLDRVMPDVPVVAEERVAAGRLPAHIGNRFILVDPLDGTKEYVQGRAEFTVNIAVIENGAPVLGVVVAPALGEGFAGGHGQAWAFGVSDAGAHTIRTIRARPRPPRLAAVLSRSHATPETLKYLEQFEIADQLSYGSSLKLCKVAEGLADIYPRLGRTMEWDIAAGDAILRAAGGLTTTMDGAPFRYGKMVQSHDAPFANPHFVAFGAWDPADIKASFQVGVA